MRIVLCVVVAVVLAGCGGLNKEQRATNTARARKMAPGTVMTEGQMAALDQDGVLVCDTESGTGSHIPHRVCRTLRRSNDQAQNAQTSVSQMPAGYGAIVNAVQAGGK
jgi:hypothetical protein